MMKQKKTKHNRHIGLKIGVILLIGALFAADQLYRLKVCNFISRDGEEHGFYIYPGATADSVLSVIKQDYRVGSALAWHLQCRLLKFNHIRPGYYAYQQKISNWGVMRRMATGVQTPVQITWTNQIRTREQLAARLASQLMMDSAAIASRLNDNTYMKDFGLKRETAVCLFRPDTYEVFWTITPDDLFHRMQKEYQRFWTDSRLNKAKQMNLTPAQVTTLASIVESETNRRAEYPAIASLYLNRLRKGMRLQACPTVIFAYGDFTLRRVTGEQLRSESPYNTYKYAGLPPGPIRCTRGTTIDDVLNAPRTDYLFMCANPDFSGNHIFSASYSQHSAVARRYRKALDQRNIH